VPEKSCKAIFEFFNSICQERTLATYRRKRTASTGYVPSSPDPKLERAVVVKKFLGESMARNF
jgi:hypothetical protein